MSDAGDADDGDDAGDETLMSETEAREFFEERAFQVSHLNSEPLWIC